MKKDKPSIKKERDEKRKKHKEKQAAKKAWQHKRWRKCALLAFTIL